MSQFTETFYRMISMMWHYIREMVAWQPWRWSEKGIVVAVFLQLAVKTEPVNGRIVK